MQLGRKRSTRFHGNAESITSNKNALVAAARRPGGDESLTAAGQRVTRSDADSLRRLVQPWQSRSFAYYNMLGEIKYAAQFYSRALALLELYVAEKNEDGELVRSEDPKVIAALERIQDPGGGRSSLLGAYGRLMFLTGEAYLFVSKDADTGLEQWEMLSTDELRITGGNEIQRIKAPSLAAESFREPSDDDWEPVGDNTAVAYRLWQRHPQFSMLADSTMQGVLDLCEELVILTRAVRSRARSRLAGSGILFIDGRLAPPPPDVDAADEDVQEDPFLADLTESMTTPIADEGAASAVVPFVVRGEVPDNMTMRDMVAHVQIVDPTQLYPETGLRYECIKRIAIGLDMPAEILTGMMEANHWTGWMIDEQSWKAHLQPKAQQLVDDLTAAYFRPALKAAGVEDFTKYSITYDASEIINHPDRAKDAKDMYDKRAIGKKALREAGGFDEDDAPTKEELAEMVGIATRDASLAWFGIPSVRQGGLEPQPGVITSKDGEAGAEGASTGAEVETGPPATGEDEVPGTVVGSLDVERVVAAADLALLRAREFAGNRVRTLARKDKTTERLIDGVRASQVPATLGRERVQALQGIVSDRELVRGCQDLVADALRVWGIDNTGLVELLVENVERHAAVTLYELRPGPLPTSFTNYLRGLASAPKALRA